MFGVSWPVLIAAVVVGSLGAARITRLFVADHWPPIEALRNAWDTWTAAERRQGWTILLHCPWCLSPWVVLVVGGLAVWSDLAWWWWAGVGWFALAYVAGWLTYHDEDYPGVNPPDPSTEA